MITLTLPVDSPPSPQLGFGDLSSSPNAISQKSQFIAPFCSNRLLNSDGREQPLKPPRNSSDPSISTPCPASRWFHHNSSFTHDAAVNLLKCCHLFRSIVTSPLQLLLLPLLTIFENSTGLRPVRLALARFWFF